MVEYESKGTVAKDAGKAVAAFAAGYAIQLGANEWFNYANNQPASVPSETVDAFVGYWSPLTSPWNFVGLIVGTGLSLVPKKPGSTGRDVARVTGHAILGAEGWGYAQHTITTGYQVPFSKVSPSGLVATKPRMLF